MKFSSIIKKWIQNFELKNIRFDNTETVVQKIRSSHLVEDPDMFVSLDENFKESVSIANIWKELQSYEVEVTFGAKQKKGEINVMQLKDTLYVPQNLRNFYKCSNCEESRSRKEIHLFAGKIDLIINYSGL